MESIQRGRLDSLFRRKCALCRRVILCAKCAHFQRFITEKLSTNKLGVAYKMVKGKWRKNVSERFKTFSSEKASICAEVEAELAEYHQVHDVILLLLFHIIIIAPTFSLKIFCLPHTFIPRTSHWILLKMFFDF